MITRVLIIIINWNQYKLTLQCLENLKSQLHNDQSLKIQIALIENGSLNESLDQIESYLKLNYSYFKIDSEVVVTCDLGLETSPNLNEVQNKILDFNQISTADLNANPEQSFDLNPQQIVGQNKNHKFNLNSFQNLDSTDLFLIPSQMNRGFSGGVNLGSKLAQRIPLDYCLLLNNDAMLPPGVLPKLIEVSRHHNKAIVGPALFDSESAHRPYFLGKIWPWFLFGSTAIPSSQQGLRRSAYIEGSCMLIPIELIKKRIQEQGSLMDDQMFLYCEDVDLCLYAAQSGVPCFVVEGVKAIHEISKSSGGKGNITAYYYITRNRILLAQKWLKPPLKFVFYFYYILSRVVLISFRLLISGSAIAQAQWQGLGDALIGKWGPKK